MNDAITIGNAIQVAATSQNVRRELAARLGDFAEAMRAAEIADEPLVDALVNYAGAVETEIDDELYLALAEATLATSQGDRWAF